MTDVKVKLLEWEDHPDRSVAMAIGRIWECRAGTNWNLYTKAIGTTASVSRGPQGSGSLPDAKAAAQADFERRILACIEGDQ